MKTGRYPADTSRIGLVALVGAAIIGLGPCLMPTRAAEPPRRMTCEKRLYEDDHRIGYFIEGENPSHLYEIRITLDSKLQQELEGKELYLCVQETGHTVRLYNEGDFYRTDRGFDVANPRRDYNYIIFIKDNSGKETPWRSFTLPIR